MPFPMKIQPIDSSFSPSEGALSKPVVKSRLKRLFERQFPNVLRISTTTEKSSTTVVGETKDVNGDFEPSSLCLAKMVQSFIEESSTTTEKQQTSAAATKCGRRRCNCFNGHCNDSSDDELDDSISGSTDAFDVLKSLVACVSIGERNLLADTAKIVEMNKICKRKEDYRKNVTDGLIALGYDAGICKSRWEKASSYPAGEYEYMDVMVDGERLIVDIDFRSEFEIARSTGNYKAVLQFLPSIFVGKGDRLQQIVSIVSEAAKLSLKKKGMHFPPWRKADYMRAKWLSPYSRTASSSSSSTPIPTTVPQIENNSNNKSTDDSDFSSEFELIFGEINNSPPPPKTEESFSMSLLSSVGSNSNGGVEKKFSVGVGSSSSPWMPPAIKPKSTSQRGSKIVAGLASVLKEKP